MISDQISNKYPNLSISQVLEESGKIVRNRLNLTQRAEGVEEARRKKEKEKKGSFARKPSGGRQPRVDEDVRTEQQRQLDEVLTLNQ